MYPKPNTKIFSDTTGEEPIPEPSEEEEESTQVSEEASVSFL